MGDDIMIVISLVCSTSLSGLAYRIRLCKGLVLKFPGCCLDDP